jgi:hypothetical protein
MSCPSYVRLRVPLTTALPRFAKWIELPELAPPREVKALRAVDEACENDDWRGVAVFVHEFEGWTLFDDFTGYLGTVPASRWVELAGDDELVFAGYNDSVPYGQLTVVREGRVVREFLADRDDPTANVNRGRLDFEKKMPLEDWTDAARFVDGDELADEGVETGLLWLFGKPSSWAKS